MEKDAVEQLMSDAPFQENEDKEEATLMAALGGNDQSERIGKDDRSTAKADENACASKRAK